MPPVVPTQLAHAICPATEDGCVAVSFAPSVPPAAHSGVPNNAITHGNEVELDIPFFNTRARFCTCCVLIMILACGGRPLLANCNYR